MNSKINEALLSACDAANKATGENIEILGEVKMNSTLIKNVWINENQVLVEFRKGVGVMYLYEFPDHESIGNWMNSDSIGKYFLANIKDKIPFVKFTAVVNEDFV